MKAQKTLLSFTSLPNSTYLFNPGAGAEWWNGVPWSHGGVPVPAGNTNEDSSRNKYSRLNWIDFEDNIQGVYNWTKFDNQLRQAITRGQMYSFRVMLICDGCEGRIPNYLHNLMQAETPKDWYYSKDNIWIPNWNSPALLSRVKALLNAIANRIATMSYNGVPYSKVIYYIDIGIFGNYGEWHTYPWYVNEPSGTKATQASLDSIIEYHLQAFPNFQLISLMSGFIAHAASFMPLETTYRILMTSNKHGRIGWRRDNWGDIRYDDDLVKNPGTYRGIRFKDTIMAMWKYAPVMGEPLVCCGTNITDPCGIPYCDLNRQATLYHLAMLGNGNWSNYTDAAIQSKAQAVFTQAGYRLKLTGGSMTTTILLNATFNVTLNWQNTGQTPVYEKWNVNYLLKKGDLVVWSGTSGFNPRLFLPSASPTAISDNLKLKGVHAGIYDLYIIIKDPMNYKRPLSLAITGRQPDGSYLIRAGIKVHS